MIYLYGIWLRYPLMFGYSLFNSYISSHASFILFINAQFRFLSRSSIFSKSTFISCFHLLVLFKLCFVLFQYLPFHCQRSSLIPFWILLQYLSGFTLIWGFSKDIIHLISASILPLLLSSLAVVTYHFFSVSVFVDKECYVWASPFWIASFLATYLPALCVCYLCCLVVIDFDLYLL